MVYTTNKDIPGIIGKLGSMLGEAGVNIANFNLGRNMPGGDAIALLYVDSPAEETLLNNLTASGFFQQAKALEFEIG